MRALSFLSLALVTSATLVACGPIAYDYSKEPDPRKSEFVLGVNDALKITVWKNPELSGEARIRPDGTITMPLIGDIHAAGRTPSSLKSEITKRLQSYVRDESAIVSVAVTEVNSYRFTVAGNVEHPGMFTSRYYVTVSEALALAGGPNRYASTSDVVLVRSVNGRPQRVAINYDKILSGDRPDEDVVVLPGDAIQVP